MGGHRGQSGHRPDHERGLPQRPHVRRLAGIDRDREQPGGGVRHPGRGLCRPARDRELHLLDRQRRCQRAVAEHGRQLGPCRQDRRRIRVDQRATVEQVPGAAVRGDPAGSRPEVLCGRVLQGGRRGRQPGRGVDRPRDRGRSHQPGRDPGGLPLPVHPDRRSGPDPEVLQGQEPLTSERLVCRRGRPHTDLGPRDLRRLAPRVPGRRLGPRGQRDRRHGQGPGHRAGLQRVSLPARQDLLLAGR